MDIFSVEVTALLCFCALSRGDLVPPDPWLAALLSALTSACPDTDIITTEIRQHQ